MAWFIIIGFIMSMPVGAIWALLPPFDWLLALFAEFELLEVRWIRIDWFLFKRFNNCYWDYWSSMSIYWLIKNPFMSIGASVGSIPPMNWLFWGYWELICWLKAPAWFIYDVFGCCCCWTWWFKGFIKFLFGDALSLKLKGPVAPWAWTTLGGLFMYIGGVITRSIMFGDIRSDGKFEKRRFSEG